MRGWSSSSPKRALGNGSGGSSKVFCSWLNTVEPASVVANGWKVHGASSCFDFYYLMTSSLSFLRSTNSFYRLINSSCLAFVWNTRLCDCSPARNSKADFTLVSLFSLVRDFSLDGKPLAWRCQIGMWFLLLVLKAGMSWLFPVSLATVLLYLSESVVEDLALLRPF